MKHLIESVIMTFLWGIRKMVVTISLLGEYLFQKYYDAKMTEWDAYRIQVSEWELERYLEIF